MKSCKEKDCTRAYYAKQFCELHYKRDRVQKQIANGEISPTRQRWYGADCLEDGCERPIHARGYCGMHYGRLSSNGDPKLVKRVSKYLGNCKAIYQDNTQCSKDAYCKEYCKKHYQQWRRYGDPFADKAKKLDPKNYVKVFQPQHPNSNKAGYIMEHRLVMSNKLGRPLYEDENVHHINGNRHDNRLENLELWSHAQPAGQRAEDKLAYAVSMLRRYMNDYPIEPIK
jgi:hypothetical protein